MANGRCRLHGGKSTGPPKGNANAGTHLGYSSVVLEQEREDFEALEGLKDLRQDLAIARLRLMRVEKWHQGLQERLYNGEKVPAADLERSFRLCDTLARTVGRLQEQEARIIEVRELEKELEGIKQRLPRSGS